jgi:hypothetical protein
MPSLRAELAELKKRMLALEARQLAWRHDSAASGSPETGASWTGPVAFELTDGMRAALDVLWERSVEYGQPFVQVAVNPCEDGETILVCAYFKDGNDTSVDFEKPKDFDWLACRRALEAHLNVQ